MAIWPNLSQKTLDLLVTPHKCKLQSVGSGAAVRLGRSRPVPPSAPTLSLFTPPEVRFFQPVSLTAAPSDTAGTLFPPPPHTHILTHISAITCEHQEKPTEALTKHRLHERRKSTAHTRSKLFFSISYTPPEQTQHKSQTPTLPLLTVPAIRGCLL